VDCIHLIEGRIQWWTAVIWLRVGFSGGLGSYGSGKDPVVDCCDMVEGRIQWWTGVVWFRKGSSGGLHSFGSG